MPEDKWVLEDSTESLATNSSVDFNWSCCSRCGLFIVIGQQSPFNIVVDIVQRNTFYLSLTVKKKKTVFCFHLTGSEKLLFF